MFNFKILPTILGLSLLVSSCGKNKLFETVTNSSEPTTRRSLPQSQTSDLKWIDNNSVVVSTGNTKCTAIRLASN